MMFSQYVEICRQLVEIRTVIADTRRNIVVNSSELGFNVVSYRSNSYASRSNSSELGFNIVLYRSNSYTTRRNSCYVAVFGKAPRTHEKPRHYSTRYVRQSTRALRDRYDLCSSHFRRRVVARFLNSLKFS